MEPWVDPSSGQELQRTLLGACSCGKLLVRPNQKTSGFDLLWNSSNMPNPASQSR